MAPREHWWQFWRSPAPALPQLTPKEEERLQRLRNRAYHLQNKIDAKPINYEMGYSRAELSALCWAIEKISGQPFKTISSRDIETRSTR